MAPTPASLGTERVARGSDGTVAGASGWQSSALYGWISLTVLGDVPDVAQLDLLVRCPRWVSRFSTGEASVTRRNVRAISTPNLFSAPGAGAPARLIPRRQPRRPLRIPVGPASTCATPSKGTRGGPAQFTVGHHVPPY